jgi:endoglucanase
MISSFCLRKLSVSLLLVSISPALPAFAATIQLQLNDQEYFTTRGLDVLVFSNWYDGNFSDAKIAGVELIHHGVRTVTNGDVRLSPTPEQWDATPTLIKRDVDKTNNTITVRLGYPDHQFEYAIKVQPTNNGVTIKVVLDKPIPAALVGKAGFNLEFLPSAYFGKSYYMDDRAASLPLYPSGPTQRSNSGEAERLPMAIGNKLVLAPEDSERLISIESHSGELGLYDGRNQAQNGWYVVRTLIPAGKQGEVIEWELKGSVIANWTRPINIAHSQVGYHTSQSKVAVLECDTNGSAPKQVTLIKVQPDGTTSKALSMTPISWGQYLRYHYYKADFSAVREPGIYMLEVAGQRTATFRIANDIYADVWHPTQDVFLPVQMDHMLVREAYRVWHGLSHMDDARQVAPNKEHFDLYGQGPATDSPFKPGEHIPGLDVGGWFDAGDFDLRTQTHYGLVQTLVRTWETFKPMRDETTINQSKRYVEIHKPDGIPDMVQQIEHGTLFLLAQHRVFGHAIPGIVEPTLHQYTHLGDAASKTDGVIDNPNDPASANDDRLAFTTATTALNYGSAAALAAASRALRGYNDAMADECLAIAKKVWQFEHQRAPNLFRVGNTTGGDPAEEELRAGLELLITTQDQQYAKRIKELWPTIDKNFAQNASQAIRALPFMSKVDKSFAAKLKRRAAQYKQERLALINENPFAVPITRAGWAGNGAVVGFATTGYYLHKQYPDLFDNSDAFNGIHYLFGTHPSSNLSWVSGVGTQSKRAGYGSNRADFSFIAGGVVPGVLILKPDFPENKEDWPFLWGENEYVVNLAGAYIFLAHAVDELTKP